MVDFRLKRVHLVVSLLMIVIGILTKCGTFASPVLLPSVNITSQSLSSAILLADQTKNSENNRLVLRNSNSISKLVGNGEQSASGGEHLSTGTKPLPNHQNSSDSHNSNNEEDDHSKDENKKEHGGHAVPPPSYQLHLHMYEYKPPGFEIYAEELSLSRLLVGFRYSAHDHYNRYIFRIRYHGHDEYSTSKMRINKTGPNDLILNKFITAPYIICVTLFSSTYSPEFPPLSTSDMCIDVAVGEAVQIGAHHSTTGLLSPLLLLVAAVLLLIIAVGHKIKKVYLKKHQTKKVKKVRKVSNGQTIEETRAKSPTEQQFDTIFDDHEIPKWQAGAYKCQIIDNKTYSNLNKAYTDDEGLEFDEYELNKLEEMFEQANQNSKSNKKVLTSLETLSHLLDDKPWISKNSRAQTKKAPVFY